MSYIRPLETGSLPQLGETTSARRIRALEEELAAYRRGNTPRPGILKYTEHENGGNGSVTRRAVAEMQEQIRSFREELRKKDHMIQHLVSLESVPRVQHSEGVRIEGLYQSDKNALERARGDAAGLQVKNERLTQQLREYEAQLEAKEIKIQELHNVLETNRENEVRLSDLVQSLRDRVRDLEDQLGSIQTVSNRGEYTISALQQELRESNDKVVELEARLRKELDERGNSALQVNETERRLTELVTQLNGLLYTTEDAFDHSAASSVDRLVRKITDLVQENALLKGKLVTLTETLNNTQVESKASRETIMRLVSEMSRDQMVTTKYTAEVENLRMERDNALATRRDLEREIELLKERLDANQRALDATKAELELREKRLTSLDREMRVNTHNVHTAATAFQLFRESLANLLSTAFESMDSSEESLKEAVRRLAVDSKEFRMKVEQYESRVQSLTEQLNHQLEIQRDVNDRAKRYEVDRHDLESKLRSAEGELAANDVLREGFKSDKEKYLYGLQRLGEVMKMDRISLDLGLDMTLDALIARAEQLVKLEADALADRTTHVYNLQRKVKSLKEQLESKDLHIDLLRKKLTALEERVHGRVSLEKNVEAEGMRVRKLERLVEKYKLQLTDARQEIQNLKAQLLGTTELKSHPFIGQERNHPFSSEERNHPFISEEREREFIQNHPFSAEERNQEFIVEGRGEMPVPFPPPAYKKKMRTMEQRKDVEELARQVQELEEERRKQARKIHHLKEEVAAADSQSQEKNVVAENAVQALSSELRTTKNALDALKYREKQLLDFRGVVSRMLGLDVNTLAVPDYEIITRLEKLIKAHHATALTTIGLEEALADASDGIVSELEVSDPVVRRSRERSRRRAGRMHLRARSLSPTKRDPRVY